MNNQLNLQRFLDAQKSSYQIALAEIKIGRKRSHWMWYIFPQAQGLGFSETSKFYAIKEASEAEAYLQHPILGQRLIEISEVLLGLKTNNATQVFGSPDDLKLKSSMTLFAALDDTNPVFQAVLDKFFGGSKDQKTLSIIGK
ncbi:DUF1810 domain-containing protein [Mucilaginibacter sp.]|uniref:DUF1810 domain-containing protein n=1 Tax=Mucilaginibacter sp. TaxID=1882438 RepID=UPI003AFF7391